MNELAYIHPLLVRNPLPPDRLRSSRERTAAACALAGSCFNGILERTLPPWPAFAARDSALRAHAQAWHDGLQPALLACLDGVGAFARRQNDALAELLPAAADAGVDPGARARLADGFAALLAGASAEQQIARQAAVSADGLRCACARDFMLFVVEADTMRRALPEAQRAAFDGAAEARQTLMGDAVVLASGAIDELGALEAAWGALAAHLDQLIAQCRNGSINSALLQARLQAARTEWSVLSDIGHLPPALRERPAPPPFQLDAPPAPAVAAPPSDELLARLDHCCAEIAALPRPPQDSAPAAQHHIGQLQTLARAWPAGARAPLAEALEALREVGAEVEHEYAPRLHEIFARMARGQADARPAVRESGMLAIRVAGLSGMLENALTALGESLAQVSALAQQLNADTTVLTGRLRQAHVQAKTLKGAIDALQRRLGAARARQRWLWRLGPLAALMNHEIDSAEEKLLQAERELQQLRGAQASTLDDAACLQGALPELTAFLGALDKTRRTLLAGLEQVGTLQSRLGELRQDLQQPQADPRQAGERLRAALAGWPPQC